MSTHTPKSSLVLLLAFAATLACLGAPALATALEAPQTLKPEPWSIGASSAILQGVLSPHSAGETGATYEFLYNASETGECKGGSTTTPGMVLGGEAEPVSEPVEGLSQQTEYAVCLIERNAAKTQEAVGPVVTFLTGPPETPENEEAVGITATSATLKATLNLQRAGEPGLYKFSYRSSESECEGPGGQETAEGLSSGAHAEAVQTIVTGLLPNTKYTFCARAFSESFQSSRGAAVTFTTPPAAPVIAHESVTSITSEEATVTAEISPGGLIGGYSLEYEPGGSTPEASLPASASPVLVSQRVSGLQAGTEYHYRFVAHNALGGVQGSREAFSTVTLARTVSEEGSCPNATLRGFSPVLPDCRAYELVSEAGEHGEVYGLGGEVEGRNQDVNSPRPFRAAADGDTVVYVAEPGQGGTGSSGKGLGNEYMARRGAAAGTGGWEAANITPPESAGENVTQAQSLAYEAFSPDLSVGVLHSAQPLLGVNATPQAPSKCHALYARDGDLATGTYGALFSETSSPGFCGFSDIFAGETLDHSVKLFDSEAALAPPAVASAGDGSNVYVSTANGEPTVVNVLPNGSVEPHAVAGGPSERSNEGPDLSDVISSDGSRVIWSAVAQEEIEGYPAAFATGLYVRENPLSSTAHTVQLDEAVQGAPGPSGDGQYWASAANDQKIFFTDCHRLTPDSTAHEEGGCAHVNPQLSTELVKTGSDLFEYQFLPGSGAKLTDLTVDHDAGDSLGADVQGVVGVSGNGDLVYFVAGGALGAKANRRSELPHSGICETASGSEEREGHVPSAFGCNLFELHFNGVEWEEPKFIARLAAADDAWQQIENAPEASGGRLSGDWRSALGSRTAEVTPSGEAIVFSSTQDLTGYDVASAAFTREDGGNEIFLFDAATEDLTCVSCSPQGAAPDLRAIMAKALTYVPVSSSGTFMHRWVNDSGTEVFFDSGQPLASADSNGALDVYEWEAEGGASCPRATSVSGGCIFLLSGGDSPDFSFLADDDESGENVFIVHRGSLADAGPRDDKFHLYDVRVNGGFAVSEHGCAGTGCQGVPPAAPIFATPASTTFAGVGNFEAGKVTTPRKATQSQKLRRALRACRKHRAKGRRKVCERRSQRRYASGFARAGRRKSSMGERTAR